MQSTIAVGTQLYRAELEESFSKRSYRIIRLEIVILSRKYNFEIQVEYFYENCRGASIRGREKRKKKKREKKKIIDEVNRFYRALASILGFYDKARRRVDSTRGYLAY